MQWLRALTLTADGAVFEFARTVLLHAVASEGEEWSARGRTTGRTLPRGSVELELLALQCWCWLQRV